MLRVLNLMRRNAVAVAALFLALCGSAFALGSNSLLGASTTQLHGCARKSDGRLRLLKAGAKCAKRESAVAWSVRGPAGAAGVRGATGLQGGQGAQGPPGPNTDVLLSGKTERGWFVADHNATAGEILSTSISFNFELPSTPTVSYVDVGGPSTASCPGTAANPLAAPGKLCLYLQAKTNLETGGPYKQGFGVDTIGVSEDDNTVDAFGAQVYGEAAATGRASFTGTYAVTAP